jgi:hypothetical protein
MIEIRVFACVLMVSACAAQPELASVEQDIRDPWCETELCENSDEIAHGGVWELNLWGQPALNGVYLRTSKKTGRAQIYKGGIGYDLNVFNGRISGTHLYFGSISGAALEDAHVELMKDGAPYYNIYIEGVRQPTTFTTPPFDLIEAYTMVWREGADPAGRFALCNAIPKNGPDEKLFELHGLAPTETVAFEGDRVDPRDKTINNGAPLNDWFNLGCAGHTLAKLYINRYSINTQPVDHWEQRQAMLKMFVADYCGVGEAFTRAGEPIAWKGGHHPNYPAGVQLTTAEKPLDARWDENGAICVMNPRMQISSHPDWSLEFQSPDAITRIHDLCPKLPICANENPQDLDGALVVNANRIPQQ